MIYRTRRNPYADLEGLARQAIVSGDQHLIIRAARMAARSRRPDVISRDGGLLDAAIGASVEDQEHPLLPSELTKEVSNLYWVARGAFNNPPVRRNADVRERELERRALGGDHEAVAALDRMRARISPDELSMTITLLLEALAAEPREWLPIMVDLVAAAREFFGPRVDALGHLFLYTGKPGLDWVYRNKLSPWRVDGLYQPAITRGLAEGGVRSHDINGGNFSLAPPWNPRPPKGPRAYQISMDTYFTAGRRGDAEQVAVELDNELDASESALADEFTPSLNGDDIEMWEVEVIGNDPLGAEDEDEDEVDLDDWDEWDVQIVMTIPFTLYHLFAMLGIHDGLEEPRKVRRHPPPSKKKKVSKKIRARREGQARQSQPVRYAGSKKKKKKVRRRR